MTEIIIAILSGGLLTALITYLLDLFKSKSEYKRDYHKKIIDKQFAVYERVEEFLNLFSTAVTDYKDKQLFYAIFGEENPLQTKYAELLNFFSKSNIWISEALRDALIAINRFILENGIDLSKVEDGKKYYHQIGELRDKALIVWKNDLIRLDNFRNFKKQIIKTDQEEILIKPIK